MKHNLLVSLFLILWILPFILFIRAMVGLEELNRQIELDKIVYEAKIEELKKQIRILNQDIELLQNHYDIYE